MQLFESVWEYTEAQKLNPPNLHHLKCSKSHHLCNSLHTCA